jgi:rhodanese-related sulfurtransferase
MFIGNALPTVASLALVSAVTTATGAEPPKAEPSAVTLEVARERVEGGKVILFDVREPHEHASGVVAGARLLPMSQVNRRFTEIPNNPNQPVLLICNSQNRSSALLRALRETGSYGNVRVVDGGMSEWAKRGWPMVKPGT